MLQNLGAALGMASFGQSMAEAQQRAAISAAEQQVVYYDNMLQLQQLQLMGRTIREKVPAIEDKKQKTRATLDEIVFKPGLGVFEDRLK